MGNLKSDKYKKQSLFDICYCNFLLEKEVRRIKFEKTIFYIKLKNCII